jgi:predicted DNA-binding protein
MLKRNGDGIMSTMVEPRIKVFFRLRQDLYTKLKFLSVSTGESMNEIVSRALEEYLNKHLDEIKKKYAEVIQQA